MPVSIKSLNTNSFESICKSMLISSQSIWPKEYADDTPECAKAFIKICHTYEETSGQTMQAPEADYLEWVIDEWFLTRRTGKVLSIEKSRRLWVSWLLCCLDVWDCGNRSITIIQGGRTYEKASDFVWRCYFIYQELRKRNPSWGLDDPKSWGNPITKHLDMVALPNGSVITKLNADGESFRGSGFARVKLEELSSWRNCASVLSQAAAVTSGPVGTTGGHIVAVSNASADDDWQEIKEVPEGYRVAFPYDAYDSKSGNRCVRIHYKADPQKTDKWALEEKSTGWSKRDWQREFELDDTIQEGKPVYEDFDEPWHCPDALKCRPWPLQEDSQYVIGMDGGNTLWPAAVLIEVGPAPWYQATAVAEWTFEGNTSMDKAIPWILDGGTDKKGRKARGLKDILPGSWNDVYWAADDTVGARQGARGDTAQKVALEMGIILHRMANTPAPRFAAVNSALIEKITYFDETTRENEVMPYFYVCGYECPMLLKGFQGAYKTVDDANKPEGHDGKLPEKNRYSHCHDALQYGMLRVREMIKRDRKPKRALASRRR